MARPRKQISKDHVESLAAINCSYKEIAAVVDCNESTLTRRYAQVIEKGREQGKSSLKRVMWDLAVNKKNVTMCIWLSKQMLGYTDKDTQTININNQANMTWDFRYGDDDNEQETIIAEAYQSPKKNAGLQEKIQLGDMGKAVGQDDKGPMEDDREADHRA